MAIPTPKRLGFCFCGLVWLGIQIPFFIPPGWPSRDIAFELKSKQGIFHFFQQGRSVVLTGAFSDRFQRFPKMELIPQMKKRGIQRIRKLILTGHDASETRALEDLQKNFQIEELNYPSDTALRMRQTFNQITSDMRFKRLEAVCAQDVSASDSDPVIGRETKQSQF